MKSASKALKINKYPLKKELLPKKTEKVNKGNNIKKDNIKINLVETKGKNEENLEKNKTTNEISQNQLSMNKTKIRTLFRKPNTQMNNITVIQNEPTIKKKKLI